MSLGNCTLEPYGALGWLLCLHSNLAFCLWGGIGTKERDGWELNGFYTEGT